MKDSRHTHEAIRTPSRTKTDKKKNPIPGYITVKLENIKDKENILKADGRKKDLLSLNKQ